MTPSAIIKQAAADCVSFALSPAGTIKATGEGQAVSRWLSVIRKHKPAMLMALKELANDTLPEAAMKVRQERVLAILAGNPALRLAVACDDEGDPIPVATSLSCTSMA